MLTTLLLLAAAFTSSHGAWGPKIRVHKGRISVDDVSRFPLITDFQINEVYTFEVYLEDTLRHDYVIRSCRMNNKEFIANWGCVQCGDCILESIETESYNKPGAIKRTLVYFIAHEQTIHFECDVDQIDCAGCAERSCQRRDIIALPHFTSKLVQMTYPEASMYTEDSYSLPFPPPISPPNVYPTPFFHHGPPFGAAPPAGAKHVSDDSGVFWPLWLWILLLILLLLLLCCLLALCLAAWWKKKRARKTTTTTTRVATTGDQAVGTEKVEVACVSTDTHDIVKCQPAVVLETNEESNRVVHHDESALIRGGSYSIREGRMHEGYTRTFPHENETAYIHRQHEHETRYPAEGNAHWNDRSSYRNFAYERDMGRVEPLDGYDEVETREKTYCLSDDEQDIIEKDIKRVHTTRYVQETREYETDGDDEKYRGDEHHIAHYTRSVPV